MSREFVLCAADVVTAEACCMNATIDIDNFGGIPIMNSTATTQNGYTTILNHSQEWGGKPTGSY